MFAAIHDAPHGRGVLAQGGLLAGRQVDAADLPVHAGGEGLAAVGAEADVHDGGAVREGPDQGAVDAIVAVAIV